MQLSYGAVGGGTSPAGGDGEARKRENEAARGVSMIAQLTHGDDHCG